MNKRCKRVQETKKDTRGHIPTKSKNRCTAAERQYYSCWYCRKFCNPITKNTEMENEPSNPQDATAEPGDGAVTDIPSVSSIEVPDRETTDLPDDATDNSVSSTTQTASGENRPADSAARDEDASMNLTITQHEAKVFQSEVEEPKMQAFFEGESQKTSSAPVSSSASLANEGISHPIEGVEYYEMRNDEKKGFFLVFCHEKFNEPDLEPLPMRFTSIELQKTWEEFGFIFDVHYDLTRDKIFEVINEYATAEHEFGCFACAVMTHGAEEDLLWAYDRAYPLKDLYRPFENCESLAGKPKLFFIEACRGEKDDFGMEYIRHTKREALKATIPVPKNAEFLIAFSTTEGFVSLSHKTRGSVFLETLNHCIKNSASVDILTILTKVIKKVAERNFNIRKGMIKQCPTILSSLTKQVVLHAPEQQSFDVISCCLCFKDKGPSVYPKQGLPGIFLILLQNYSDNSVREDFKKDARNLEVVLTKLGFEVRFHLFSDEANIINILKTHAKKPENRTCFACVVLSVGVDGYEIFAEESSYHYKQMIQPFIDCKEWVGKPKIFFIQANVDETMRSLSAQRDYYPRNVSLSPEEADVLIVFSRYSYRRNDWFTVYKQFDRLYAEILPSGSTYDSYQSGWRSRAGDNFR